MAPDMDAAGPVGTAIQRLTHGFGEQSSQVAGRQSALHLHVREHRASALGDHQTEVVRFVLHHRLWQRPQVRFPGLIL
jgi:hypothetical protein